MDRSKRNCNIPRVFREAKGTSPLLPERPAGCCAQKGTVPFYNSVCFFDSVTVFLDRAIALTERRPQNRAVQKHESIPATPLIACGICLVSLPLLAGEYFASPTGSPRGTGQCANPWDLATALSSESRLAAGDTLYLLGGTYRGQFASRVAGTPERPIRIRPASGQHVVIDCRSENDGNPRFVIEGSWCEFIGLEFTCSDRRRVTEIAGSWPADVRRGSVSCIGRGVKLINLLVHDLADGIGCSSTAEGGEVYGCIISNNGWLGPDRGHGHGIYAQNQGAVRRIADNIIFNQFGFGVHCYGSDKAVLEHFEIEGNVVFNNGCQVAPDNRACNMLVGGDCPLRDAKIVGNVVYSDRKGPAPWLGYADDVRNEAVVEDNYLVGGITIKRCEPLVFRRNRLMGEYSWIRLEAWAEPQPHGLVWEGNVYHQTNDIPLQMIAVRGSRTGDFTLEQWSKQFPESQKSVLTQGIPQGVQVIVCPNRYEAGRRTSLC